MSDNVRPLWPQPPRPAREAPTTLASSTMEAARKAQADAIALAEASARGALGTLIEGALQAGEAADLLNQRPGVAAELRRVATDLSPSLMRLAALLASEPG